MEIQSFSYTHEELAAIESTMSASRFGPYVAQAKGSKYDALRSYEKNISLSEALFGIIQAVEIALRNTVHRSLASAFSEEWYWHPRLPQLRHPLAEMVEDAILNLENHRRSVSAGAIVAELSFGFWTGMLSRKYEKEIWVPYLHKAFPSGMKRSTVAERFERIRQLRNRIAHHEPILHYRLDVRYQEIIECISWLCPTTAAWVSRTNSFPQRFNQ